MNSKNRLVAAIDIGSYKTTTLIAQVATDLSSLENSISIVGASRVLKKARLLILKKQ